MTRPGKAPRAQPHPSTEWRAQPAVIAVVIAVASLVAAAVAKGLDAPRGVIIAVIALVAVLVATGVLVARTQRWTARYDKPGPSGRPVPLSEIEPDQLRLHRHRFDRPGAYLRRHVDDDLLRAVRTSSIVVLHGPPRAGKTRTLRRAVAGANRDGDPFVLVTRPSTLRRDVLDRRRDGRPTVLWLRELDAQVCEVLGEVVGDLPPAGTVVVIETDDQTFRSLSGDLPRERRALHLPGDLSGRELSAAARALDADEDEVVRLGWYLSDRMEDLRSVTDAAVYALIEATVDWDRTGAPRGVTQAELAWLMPEYLEPGDVPPADLDQALERACSRTVAGSAALRRERYVEQLLFRADRGLARHIARTHRVHPPAWDAAVDGLTVSELAPVRARADRAREGRIVERIDEKTREGHRVGARSRAGAGAEDDTPARTRAASRPGPARPPRRATLPALGDVLVGIACVVVVVVLAVLFVPGPDGSRPASRNDAGGPVPASSSPPSPSSSSPSSPSSAVDGLVRTADADRGDVDAVVEAWVPQLAGKQVERFADSPTYTPGQILSEYRSLRDAYPEARMLRSDRWAATFTNPGLWVTVVTVPFPTPEAVLEWCTAKGRPVPTSCFAARLSRTSGTNIVTRPRR